MPNLVLSGFPAEHRDTVHALLHRLDGLTILAKGSEAEAVETLDAGIPAAYCPFWSLAPSPQQLETVKQVAQRRIPVIPVLSAGVTSDAKLAAIRAGALDCLTLNALDGRFVQLVELFASRSLTIENSVRQKIAISPGDELVLESPEMIELINRLSRVATLGSTILLTGETGVGKTMLARWIHNHSARSDKPFVEVPCASIPAEAMEIELFGQAPGGKPGADKDLAGKFSTAGNGTLLIDEIDCLPIDIQAKLLRVVEQKKYERIGSGSTERCHARLIVATNHPLESLVKQGHFRADLFYRLRVLSFRVPALRERPQAIRVLADKFCKRFAAEHARPICGISASALQTLETYSWPGNVRELRNAMEHAVALATSNKIEWHDLPEDIRYPKDLTTANPSTTASENQLIQLTHGDHPPDTQLSPKLVTSGNQLAKAREDAERDKLLSTLRAVNFNRTRAAAALGISRVTLYKRMLKLNLSSSLTH